MKVFKYIVLQNYWLVELNHLFLKNEIIYISEFFDKNTQNAFKERLVFKEDKTLIGIWEIDFSQTEKYPDIFKTVQE